MLNTLELSPHSSVLQPFPAIRSNAGALWPSWLYQDSVKNRVRQKESRYDGNGVSLVVHTLFSHADLDGRSHIVNDPEEIRHPATPQHYLRVMDLLQAHGATLS